MTKQQAKPDTMSVDVQDEQDEQDSDTVDHAALAIATIREQAGSFAASITAARDTVQQWCMAIDAMPERDDAVAVCSAVLEIVQNTHGLNVDRLAGFLNENLVKVKLIQKDGNWIAKNGGKADKYESTISTCGHAWFEWVAVGKLSAEPAPLDAEKVARAAIKRLLQDNPQFEDADLAHYFKVSLVRTVRAELDASPAAQKAAPLATPEEMGAESEAV